MASFYQCGDRYRLDPLTLDDLGRHRAAGSRATGGVSAHTKVDEATGELLFFSYCRDAPYLHYGVVNAGDDLRALRAGRPARAAPAARHGLHRALRDPERPAAVLGPGRSSRGRLRRALPPGSAVAVRASSRVGRPRRHPLVRGRAHLRAALDQRVRRGRRDRPRRLLPGRPVPDSRRARRPPKDRMFRFLAQDLMQPGCTAGASTCVTGATSEEDLSDMLHRVRHDRQRVRRTAAIGTITPPPTSRAGSSSTASSSTTR